jgi:IMP dehydrogenase
MASAEAQEDRGWGSNEVKVAPEGVATTVPCRGPVGPIVHELTMGLKSGMSYCNARFLREIALNAEWQKQTQSAYIEGTPHILRGRV